MNLLSACINATTASCSPHWRVSAIGNTVIVVEHDEETIRTADYVVDLGPGAGEHGGKVIFQGAPELLNDGHGSLTGAYLRGERSIPTPKARRPLLEGDHHSWRPREQSQEHRRIYSARDVDRGHRRERLGQVDARQRHSLSVSRRSSTRHRRSPDRMTASTVPSSSTRSSRSTSRQSAAPRDRTRPPTRACSRSSASYSR